MRMKKPFMCSGCVFLVLVFILCWPGVSMANTFDVSMMHEAENSIARALEFLGGEQAEDGSWGHYPGITGLVLNAFMRAPESNRQTYQDQLRKGYEYLLSNVQQDGGIYPPVEPQLKAYNTSVVLMALVAADNPGFEQTILNARRYLMSLQADEDDGVMPDSSTYGGIGYNKDERSDISNMQFALEAIRASEQYAMLADAGDRVSMEGNEQSAAFDPASEKLFWEKAITFLQHCQNHKEYNDFTWSGDDGGFVYYPGVSKAGGTTSYGGMTYAGLKSFIHAGLSPEDDRVQAAYHWIQSNFTVDENPELGRQGLFYYYHVMAKALAIYGDSIIVDTSGVSHDWRGVLANKLLTIQGSDGSWVNDNGRWWENNPVLVTAYCLMALEEMMR
jgi:squalene-hopene/tetraprenyl-beta-curcumene cyclase